jgi:hypothetical protein
VKRFLKAMVVGVGFVGFALVAGLIIWAIADHFGWRSEGTPAQEAYGPSNEILYPDQLSKNPYRWKGHSGILDTRIAMEGPAGRFLFSYPGGCLKFERMIDEHTATFEVLVGSEEIMPDGEIAVILEDSEPPDPARPWRVFVEGPREGVNGLGNSITVSTVRFEGYAVIPQPQPQQVAPPIPAPQSAPEPPAPPPDNLRSDGTPPAPIIRP